MPGTYLGFPFNAEIFNYTWQNTVDPTLTAMYDSGAVMPNGNIKSLISNGSDIFTTPIYNLIGGTPANYDGATDIPVESTSGTSQTGVVYGRTQGWKESGFVRDFNSGADPMTQITTQVVKFWQKKRQARMLKILDGIFGITTSETSGEAYDWVNMHKTSIASASTSVSVTNKLGVTTLAEAMQKAVGDNSGIFSLAFMHSKVALNLASLGLIEFKKYTDINGIERPLNVASGINGLTIIVDDSAPHTAATSSAAETYTTYILGNGALQYADAPVEVPSEVERDPKTNGGENVLYTRIRETIHPNGFSFTVPSSGYTNSPTDAQLGTSAQWSIAGLAKNIAMAKIVSNG